MSLSAGTRVMSTTPNRPACCAPQLPNCESIKLVSHTPSLENRSCHSKLSCLDPERLKYYVPDNHLKNRWIDDLCCLLRHSYSVGLMAL